MLRAVRFKGPLIAVIVACACLRGGPAEPARSGSGTAILFIGNSYTSVNDIPGIVQALADSAGGERIAVQSLVNPNYAVIDHWSDGIAQREIAKGGWKYVVLQQGWTPAGVCRDTLRLATQLFAPGIKRVGARPSLFEAWAPQRQPNQFAGSIESYRLAAKDVEGLLFPVAEAWLAAWRHDGNISFYLDGLHANQTGSYLAALVIYTRVVNRSPVGLPPRLVTRSGVLIRIDAGLARLLQDAAAEVGLAPTPDEEPTAPPVITSRC